MPSAKRLDCRVIATKKLTPTVVSLHLLPPRKVSFEAGQFISVVIPDPSSKHKFTKRCYSLANAPENVATEGIELCVKVVPGGKGSTYLARLKVGDTVQIYAPYGDFTFQPPAADKSVCFIATGTGIAPLRSMLLSEKFQQSRPKEALVIFGARTEDELLYAGEFEKMGASEIHAISRPSENWLGFRGRVTDYLRTLPTDWNWHNTVFYLCGNGGMVDEIDSLLRNGLGVPAANIHLERFSPPGRVFPFLIPSVASGESEPNSQPEADKANEAEPKKMRGIGWPLRRRA